jgi:hypothetical protein
LRALKGSIDFVGDAERPLSPEEGAEVLRKRAPRDDLAPHPLLPDDTRLWAVLQSVSGGTWGGCVFDAEAIRSRLLG